MNITVKHPTEVDVQRWGQGQAGHTLRMPRKHWEAGQAEGRGSGISMGAVSAASLSPAFMGSLFTRIKGKDTSYSLLPLGMVT